MLLLRSAGKDAIVSNMNAVVKRNKDVPNQSFIEVATHVTEAFPDASIGSIPLQVFSLLFFFPQFAHLRNVWWTVSTI
jgi:hypothetical protein